MWSWLCQPCDVEGRDGGDSAPECWNCGGPVVVTARPTISDEVPDDVSDN
jgi:hypothetical protein